MEHRLPQFHARGVPVERVFLHHHRVVDAPFPEHERPVADEAAGLRPVALAAHVGVVFFERGAVDGIERVLREQREPERRALLERDLEGPRIRRAETDGGKVVRPALAVVLRACHPIRVDGHFRPELGLDDTAEAVEKIRRGEWVAVAPLQAGPQVEGVRAPIGGNVPAFRRAGQDRFAIGRKIHQPLKQRGDDVGLRVAGGDAGVEVARLRAVADVEDLLAVADLDGRLAPVAAGGEQRDQQRGGGKFRGHV